MSKQLEHTTSSGNVFADLGFENPEEMQFRSQLAMMIKDVIQKRKWNQTHAAEVLGVSQSDVSNIYNGKIDKFTIDRLLRFLRLLQRDIVFSTKTTRQPKGRFILRTGTHAQTA